MNKILSNHAIIAVICKKKEDKEMIEVIFEVHIPKEKLAFYLELAEELKPSLKKTPGFISSERFTSLTQPEKLLSLSKWENEESLTLWRNETQHRLKQKIGREKIFTHYQITVTKTLRCYTENKRQEAPVDSNAFFKL